MERRKAIRKGLVFGMVLALVAILFVGVPMNVSADSTIYIDEFGNIIPSTAPITRVGDVYTLTANVYETIIIQKSGITLDGDGYSIIKGSGFNGVYVRDQTDVTIKNLNINGFYHGIALYYSNDCTISGNKVTGSSNSGIYLSHSDWG